MDSLELLDLVLFSPIFRGVLMDLFLREATERIGADDALSRIDALLDWRSFSPILKRGLGRSGVGVSAGAKMTRVAGAKVTRL